MAFWNKDISSMPKNATVVAYCDDAADETFGEDRLSIYRSHAELGLNAGTGLRAVCWGGAFDDRSYEYPNGGYMTDWWFVDDGDFETPANPIAWLDEMPHLDFLTTDKDSAR